MNPTADDIACVVILVAGANSVDPEDVMTRRIKRGNSHGITPARKTIALALHGAYGRRANWWVTRFKWTATSNTASQYIRDAKNRGCHRSDLFREARELLGMPAELPPRRTQGIEAAEKRCEETAQAARAELAKSDPPAPAPKPVRIVGSLSANRTKPEPKAPAPMAPPTSEEEAAARLFASIPDRRSF
jgi:hypothetical protein